MEKPFTYTFTDGHTADVIQVNSFVELSNALQSLGFDSHVPVLVLVGGASGISEADMLRLKQLFITEIAPLVQKLGVAVVDGGTDAGIMRLIGQARTEISATFPLIGVAAIDTVTLCDRPVPRPDAAPLEPNHTHFVLVPGSNWGDESPWLSRIATLLSDGFPSVTLVVNGGEITFQDVSNSVKADRPVVVLNGSGRTADKLAAALRGEVTDPRAHELADSGQLQTINLIKQPSRFAREMTNMLAKILHF